jgi:two-component system, OmpR family, KDP operon response regulator KdpE
VTRILVVDDEPALARALAINLRAHGYDVAIAANGRAALVAASAQPPALVVLDLGLPDMDGVEVVEGLRGWSTVPVLVLSARHEQTQKVAALDAGADDYITKPFGMDEFLARVRAALRRTGPADEGTARVTTDAFVVDLVAHTVTAGEREVRLTPTEWHLLEVLVRNPGRLVPQRQLLQEVWGPQYGSESNYLRVYVSQLRRKLEPDPTRPRHILTQPGVGYRFEP